MAQLTLGWRDPDAARPAHDVVIRLTACTDRAAETGDITPYLMTRVSGGHWAWTAKLPGDLRTSYQLCPVRDRPLRGQPLGEDRWAEVVAAGPRSWPPGWRTRRAATSCRRAASTATQARPRRS